MAFGLGGVRQAVVDGAVIGCVPCCPLSVSSHVWSPFVSAEGGVVGWKS